MSRTNRLTADTTNLLAEDGVLIATPRCPISIAPRQRITWWYALPRNGHISLFSKQSLAVLAADTVPLPPKPGGFSAGLLDVEVANTRQPLLWAGNLSGPAEAAPSFGPAGGMTPGPISARFRLGAGSCGKAWRALIPAARTVSVAVVALLPPPASLGA
ncbi:MAG: hypothetical protein IPK65_06910 [Gammaproteobacteria bacterium]|nr:hypothetical protein [Gammaproteobacteria bacterium]